MGIHKYRCEQCNKWYFMEDMINTHSLNDPYARDRKRHHYEESGIPEGDYNSRFCSKLCAQEWEQAHPGKSSKTIGQRATKGCLLAPFKLAWWLTKIGWKVMTNKWVVTIFTAGIAWLAWKALDKIYCPKD